MVNTQQTLNTFVLTNSFSSHSGRKQQLVSAIHHYLVYAHLIICICEVIELLNYCYQIYKNFTMVCTLIDLRNDVKCSLRSKRFQSSYCAKVRAEAKKRLKGEGEGRRGNACLQTPRFWKTPLDISRFGSFVS